MKALLFNTRVIYRLVSTCGYNRLFSNCFHLLLRVSDWPRSECPSLHEEPTKPLGGFSISWPLGIFVPADLLTAFVSSLSQSSSPSRHCICFIVFHLRSDMKQSLPPRVRAASTDRPSHFSLFHLERLFLTWGGLMGAYLKHVFFFLQTFYFYFFKEKTVFPNIRRIIQTLLGIVDSDFYHLKQSHSADVLAK